MTIVARTLFWTIMAVLVAGSLWQHNTVSDNDGWYPAPPTPVRVSGEVSGFYSGSVTDNPKSFPLHTFFTKVILSWDHSPISDRGDPELIVEDLTAHQVVEDILGTPVDGVLSTPRLATGTSSGLAATLALLDSGTAGSLLPGGKPVGATGVINADHTISSIGGADAKARGMLSTGITVFLVPDVNYQEVGQHAGLRVLPVSTVEQAVRRLCRLGADDALCGYLRETRKPAQ